MPNARHAGVVLMIVLSFGAPLCGSEHRGPATIVVRTYNYVSAPDSLIESARRETEAVFDGAGLRVIWIDCAVDRHGQPGKLESCTAPLGDNELLLRLLAAHAEASGRQASLGFSLVDPRDPRPVLATIYLDRVLEVAESGRLERAPILGRAMAHELGHLLLRSTGHAPSGLMRAFWFQTELRGERASDWQFSRREAASMRAALDARSTAAIVMASK